MCRVFPILKATIYPITAAAPYRVSIVARRSGNDWLSDEVSACHLLDDIRNRRFPDAPKPKRAEILGEQCPLGHKLEGADRWCPVCYRRYSECEF